MPKTIRCLAAVGRNYNSTRNIAEWFANRLREGCVLVRNPYNQGQVTRYRLDPEVVDLIAFCTKNPEPMFPYMELLRPYGMYWFMTITGYDKDIEPAVPSIVKSIANFKKLSDMVGGDSTGWRYDPIFINDKYTIEEHLKRFEMIASALDGYTKTCVISFIDLYSKVRKNFPEARTVTREERLYLGGKMVQIAGEHGMVIKPCGEGDELEKFGANCRDCMTRETYETALHTHLDIPNRKPLRKECACFMGNDIGVYNTCPHMCRYCYANYDEETVRRNYRFHNPKSPFLIGDSMPWDAEVHEAEQHSWVDGQMTLDMLFGI